MHYFFLHSWQGFPGLQACLQWTPRQLPPRFPDIPDRAYGPLSVVPLRCLFRLVPVPRLSDPQPNSSSPTARVFLRQIRKPFNGIGSCNKPFAFLSVLSYTVGGSWRPAFMPVNVPALHFIQLVSWLGFQKLRREQEPSRCFES